MTDETNDKGQELEGLALEGQELRDVAAEILGRDKIEGLTEEEIKQRLVSTDSGATLGHDEVLAGLRSELRAQSQVVDLLSEQREPEGLNIAKVLDSSKIDLAVLTATAVTEETKNIIGPKADPARRKAIQQEITLPFKAAFTMCMRSVIIRLGRVAITGSGIFLGIAFYSSVRVTAAIMAASGEAAEADKARQIWLIVMALMVSVVGICNSMLMAVAERFREIGTMKCLGALDEFVVKLFLIESGLLGLLAGFSGCLVGGGLMYIVNASRYNFNFVDVAGSMGMTLIYSVVLGTVLSILAAILPAQQAAKMPAAAALRTDV